MMMRMKYNHLALEKMFLTKFFDLDEALQMVKKVHEVMAQLGEDETRICLPQYMQNVMI